MYITGHTTCVYVYIHTYMHTTVCIQIFFYRVNVSVKRIGGGFGAKLTRSQQVAAGCALAAYHTRRYAYIFTKKITAIFVDQPYYCQTCIMYLHTNFIKTNKYFNSVCACYIHTYVYIQLNCCC